MENQSLHTSSRNVCANHISRDKSQYFHSQKRKCSRSSTLALELIAPNQATNPDRRNDDTNRKPFFATNPHNCRTPNLRQSACLHDGSCTGKRERVRYRLKLLDLKSIKSKQPQQEFVASKVQLQSVFFTNCDRFPTQTPGTRRSKTPFPSLSRRANKSFASNLENVANLVCWVLQNL